MKNFLISKFNFSANFIFTLMFILALSQYFVVYGQNIPWDKRGIVLDVGPPGSWDDTGVGVPCVIYENDTLHMWYGAGVSGYARIGYATTQIPMGKVGQKTQFIIPSSVLPLGNGIILE